MSKPGQSPAPAGVAVLLLCLIALASAHAAAEGDAVLRGREVYIAEGCINCHSQYVRPQVATDVERWGPASSPAERHEESPPLLGNRRDGPDLANVGLRRSPAWNRLHLLNPAAISPGSVMPTYAHLFAAGDPRGPDLVAYLGSLGRERMEERNDFIARWRPATTTDNLTAAGPLFATLCIACHGPAGHGDGTMSAALVPAPPDWTRGPRYRPATGEDELLFLARLIKFGLPNSPMAGHEYLPDSEVLGLARYVQSLQAAAPRP